MIHVSPLMDGCKLQITVIVRNHGPALVVQIVVEVGKLRSLQEVKH